MSYKNGTDPRANCEGNEAPNTGAGLPETELRFYARYLCRDCPLEIRCQMDMSIDGLWKIRAGHTYAEYLAGLPEPTNTV